MTGRGHLGSGTVVLADTFLIRYYLGRYASEPVLLAVTDFVNRHLSVFATVNDGYLRWAMFAITICLFYIGLLLPDIDKHSTISKFIGFHFEVPHRGVFHSVWHIMMYAVIGIFICYPVRFLAIGMLLHCLADYYSPAGWVPFYPLGWYYISNDTVFTKRRHLVLYSTVEPEQEGLVVAMMFVVTITICVLCEVLI